MPKFSSLEKSLSVLEAVFKSTEGIGTRALQQQLGYNVATIHNIAQTFCDRGYLRQDRESRRFFPGLRLIMLGRHPDYLQTLTSSVSAIVDEVARKLDESVLLASIEGGRILNLKYVPGKQALRVHEPEDVSEHAYATAFGKVLLTTLSQADLEAYFRGNTLQAFTPKTLSTPERLRAELAKVRRNDFASTCDEYCEGVSAVAVPIRDPWGAVIASIGASAPTLRMQRKAYFNENLATLKKAAGDIGRIWNASLTNESSGNPQQSPTS